MKFLSACFLTTAAALMLVPSVTGQDFRESADPYFQPKGAVKRSNTNQGFQAKTQTNLNAPSSSANASAKTSNKFATGSSTFKPSPSGGLAGDGTFGGSSTKNADPQALVDQQIKPPRTQETSTPAVSQESFERARVLARVGGEPIFFSDLSVEAMQLIDKFMGPAPLSVKQREVKNLIPRLLPKYIQSKLLLVDAIDGLPEGANIDDIYDSAGKQFDEMMVPTLMKKVKVESPAKLDAYYRQLGSSLRSVRKSWVESELVKYTMRSKINVDPDVSHREMYEHYLANKEKYSVPAKVRWEQIMVRFDKFPTRAAAEAAIKEMGSEVVYGAPLSAVAKRSSQGYKAGEGGQQGWTTRGSLVDKNLDQLLFSVEPGKLSEITQTSRGLAIIRVQERSDAGFVPFETAQGEIKKKIINDKQEAEFQNYVSKVKARVPVEIFEPEHVANTPGSKIR